MDAGLGPLAVVRSTPSRDAGPGQSPGLSALVAEVRACRVCASLLPLGPRPILHVSPTARLLIASQAPGTRVHEAGISFWDASGDRLRGWLGLDRATFYR